MAGPSSPLYGIPISEIARICDVDASTARRWKRGATCPPPSALKLLAGDLGCFDPKWSGWHLQNGLLVSPEGWSASVGDVMSIQLTQGQLSAYRIENKRLQAQLKDEYVESFEEQPRPENWEIAFG
jgi:hypothetical protein